MAPGQSMGLRSTTLALVAGLIAIGLFAASPFLCDRLVGTGESYNYSLSVADSLQQMRKGTVPPLVGQGTYAFNGRIHPLRDAPYLFYLAAGIDLATRHRLSFWAIQNISLSLSIVGAALACFIGLRRGAGCPPLASFVLSAVYALSPALLGAAYSFDLFMTVHAAPFVALAVAACVRGIIQRSFSADAWLAAALAGAWFAHPPVALWLTLGVVFVRLAAFLLSPSWRVLISGTFAVILAGALASFVFVSVLTLNADLSLLSGGDIYSGVAAAIVQVVKSAFPASVMPVGRLANSVGDLQFGYAAWLVLALTGFCHVWAALGRVKLERSVKIASAAALAYAALLLVLVLPVPFLNPFLWRHVPYIVIALTNTWPMQRLYLVAVPFTLFAAAVVVPETLRGARLPRWLVPAAVALGTAWCLYEAHFYVARGMLNRWTPEVTRAAYRPSNVDLTETSYSYFGVPPSFVYGVADPGFEFRLLRGGTDEIDSPTASTLRSGAVVDQGVLRVSTPSFFTLQPGKHYLLTFSFRTAPADGFIQLIGPLIQRGYTLPTSGRGRSFGMREGNRRSFSVWTDGDSPERVGMRMGLTGKPAPAVPNDIFADYTLREVLPEQLSIRVLSLIPLRFTVDAPEAGCTVETPRCFLAGYAATANGARVVPVISPDRLVMVPVPKGHSVVELRYEGSRALHFSFWLSAASWLAFILWRLVGSPLPTRLLAAPRWVRLHRTASTAALVLVLLASAVTWRRHLQHAHLAQVGPMQVDFTLPYGKLGVRQPLLTTGHPTAAVVVNVLCIDTTHVKIGADVWGQYVESDPIELDFSGIQSLVVSDSALFPLGHPLVAALPQPEQAALRGELRIELNGRTVVRHSCYAYETTQSEIEVGKARFGSMAEGKFSGTIIGSRRLPIPRSFPLPRGQRVHLQLKFPTDLEGRSEPLVSESSGGRSCGCFVTYLPGSKLRFTSWTSGGAAPASVEVAYDPSIVHQMEFTAGDAGGSGNSLMAGCEFDGAVIFGSAHLRAPDIPPVVVAGVNLAAVPGVLDRFNGTRMDVTAVTSVSQPAPLGRAGTLHMIVTFPEHKDGRSEPLLTTGRNGAGDIVYVTYLDKDHVRIGFDHWGGGGAISPPVEIDYSVPHEIWITLSTLDSAAAPAKGAKVEVLLDARSVISSDTLPFPTTGAQVSFLKNPIGGSTSDPQFSGYLHFAEQVGQASSPPRG